MKPVSIYLPCDACGGHGRVPGQSHLPRTRLCPDCKGSGLALTEDGKAIISLLRAASVKGLLPEGGGDEVTR